MVLHGGGIAEMRTGEGKTLVATLPVYLNALTGKGVHVVTVNDYLAKRDAEWMGRVYKFLGLSVGVIVHGLSDEERREAYACDITYATNNELGFDYLRDNMKYERAQMVQRGHHFAIVDEVDSILIDEARTPLIISGPLEDRSEMYNTIDAFMQKLMPSDYEVDEKQKTSIFTEEGTEKLENMLRAAGLLKGESLYDIENVAIVHHVNNALKAHRLFQKDKDYIVKRWRDRHHRRVHRPHDAGPPLFRRPAPGARSQGACGDPAGEPDAGLGHLPELFPHVREARRHDRHGADRSRGIRQHLQSRCHRGSDQPAGQPHRRGRRGLPDGRREVQGDRPRDQGSHAKGQPILVGTTSIEKSEQLAERLRKDGFKDFEVLNARHHEREAAIVAQAGKPGAITIATNMAGRGTDIQLGGNADMRIAEELGDMPEGPERDAMEKAIREDVARLKEKALAAGGLYVLATERHESRRIDNQLRGRSGRQGDPGRSKFFLSLQDDLMRIFGSERMDGMLQKLGLKEDEAIIHPWINKALEKAQKKVEARNFDIRKNLLKYDDVQNDQRKVVFEQRIELMDGESLSETVAEMRNDVIEDLVTKHIPENAYAEQWDVAGLKEGVLQNLNLDLPVDEWAKEEGIADEEVRERITAEADKAAADRAERFGPEVMTYVERSVVLQTLDHLWREHLVNLDHLRSVVGFRGYAQRDPLNEYKGEAFELFQAMLGNLRQAVTRAADARRARAPGRRRPAAGSAGDVRPPYRRHHRRGRFRRRRGGGPAGRARRRRRRPRSQRPLDLGQGRPQRGLPLRLGQEVQALPRRLRLTGRSGR